MEIVYGRPGLKRALGKRTLALSHRLLEEVSFGKRAEKL